MRRFKYGFLKLFSNAAGRQAVESLIEDLLGIHNSPAPIYDVRNISGSSRSDDNAHLVGFQIQEIDSKMTKRPRLHRSQVMNTSKHVLLVIIVQTLLTATLLCRTERVN